MSFIFSTSTAVPANTIKEIGLELQKRAMIRLLQMGGLTDEDLDKITYAFSKELFKLVIENVATVDGLSLKKDDVSFIANLLKNGKRISAIKEFRSVTGIGLREAKDFIDEFPSDVRGALDFMNTFT